MGRALRWLPDWILVLLFWAVLPVLVFGGLLAVVGLLDEVLERPLWSTLATLGALVLGGVVGALVGASHRKQSRAGESGEPGERRGKLES